MCKRRLSKPLIDACVLGESLINQVSKVVEEAKRQYGKVDGVASCVGSMLIKPAHLTSDEEFMECIRLNAFSSFNILKATVSCKSTS